MFGMLMVGVAGLASCGMFGGPPNPAMSGLPNDPDIHYATMKVDGVERSYYVYTPNGWREHPNKTWPVVILYHGTGDRSEYKGKEAAVGSAMWEVADQKGFIAVFPNSQDGMWYAQPNPPADRSDDFKYSSRLLSKVVSDFRADPNRIVVAGFSNGGHMAQLISCQFPERIRGAVWVAASTLDSTPARCDGGSAKRVPLLMYLSTSDPINPYDGGRINIEDVTHRQDRPENLVVLSARETADYWAKRNGCSVRADEVTLPDKVADGTRVKRLDYQGCPDGAGVELLSCVGGAHTWPGGSAKNDKCRDLPLSPYIVEYFERFGVQL